jgi:hypothetical protein
MKYIVLAEVMFAAIVTTRNLRLYQAKNIAIVSGKKNRRSNAVKRVIQY